MRTNPVFHFLFPQYLMFNFTKILVLFLSVFGIVSKNFFHLKPSWFLYNLYNLNFLVCAIYTLFSSSLLLFFLIIFKTSAICIKNGKTLHVRLYFRTFFSRRRFSVSLPPAAFTKFIVSFRYSLRFPEHSGILFLIFLKHSLPILTY